MSSKLGSSQRRATYRTVGEGSRVYKKKMEGFDGGESRVNGHSKTMTSNMRNNKSRPSAKTLNANFTSNVESLKKQTAKQVEDEYIKALQEEIKILEYQLKILKDKEVEQQAAVSQIDKFFSDGIPLNDNILALKTQYQSKKRDGEGFIQILQNKKEMQIRLSSDLRHHIQQLKSQNEILEKETLEKEAFLISEIDRLRTEVFNEKYTKIDNDKLFRELQHEYKKITDDNLKMNRDLEKEKVLTSHKEDIALTQREKLKRELEDTELMVKEVQADVDLLSSEMSLNPMVKKYEQKNLELKGKILKCEKQIGLASQKIKEAEMLLDTRANEMELEAEQKRDLLNQKEIIQLEIDEANKMNELIVQQKVREKEEADIRDKKREIEEVIKQRNLVQDRMQTEEDGIERIVQDKVTIQQDIIENEQISEQNDKDRGIFSKKSHELKIQNDFLNQKERDLNSRIEPLEQEIENYKASIPSYEQEIKKFQEQIDFYEKQIEFSQQVKSLDLNEVQVLNASNVNVNETVIEFIKKYEELQRRSALSKEGINGLN